MVDVNAGKLEPLDANPEIVGDCNAMKQNTSMMLMVFIELDIFETVST